MAHVCPECHRPVKVKPGAKEGRCRKHRPRPKVRRRRLVEEVPGYGPQAARP